MMVSIPKELQCPICNDLLEEAVMMPCCAGSACDFCARKGIVKSGSNCPVCEEEVVTAEDLIPYRLIRDKVDKYCKNTGYAKPTPNKSQARPTLPDIVLPTLQGRTAPPSSPRSASPPRQSTPPVTPGTPLSPHHPSTGTPYSRHDKRNSRCSPEFSRYPGPTLLPPSHVLTQPTRTSFIDPSDDPLVAFEAAMRQLDAKKASQGRGRIGRSQEYRRGFRDRSRERYRDYSPLRSPDRSLRSYSSRGQEKSVNRSPSFTYQDHTWLGKCYSRESSGRRRRERFVADIPPETEEEKRERENFEKELARRECYEKKKEGIVSDREEVLVSPSPSQNISPAVSYAQDLRHNVDPVGRDEEEHLDVRSKSRENLGSLGVCKPTNTVESRKIRRSALASMDLSEDTLEKRHKESNKLSPNHGDDDGMKSPMQENSRKKSKKKKSKKSKKSKMKDYDDENQNKKVKKKKSKRKMTDSEKSISKRLNEKPLVPYANADDTATDDSVEKTEVAGDSKKRYHLEKEVGVNFQTVGDIESNEVVSMQGPALNDYPDSQIPRKTTESSSSMPESCKWNKDILDGNDILEDNEVEVSNLEAENRDTLEFGRIEKPKLNGGRNMLKRALANIIEKEKLKVGERREVSDVKQKKRKTKKKKKRRKELSNEEDSDEKSLMAKTSNRSKLADHRVSEKALKKLLKIHKMKKKELSSFYDGYKSKNEAAKQVKRRTSPSKRSIKNSEKKEKSSNIGVKLKVYGDEIHERKKTGRVDEDREVRSSKMGSIQVKLDNKKNKQMVPTVTKPSLASTVQEKLLRLAGGVQAKEMDRREEDRIKSVRERLGPVRDIYSPIRSRDKSVSRDNIRGNRRESRDKNRNHDHKFGQMPPALQSCAKRDDIKLKHSSRHIARSQERGRSRSRSRDNPRAIVRRRGSGRGKD